MIKKNHLLIAVLAVLAAVYVICFSGWFKPKTMRIFETYRKLSARPAMFNALPDLHFGLGREFQLKEIKVVSCADLQNKNPLPLWHLVSDSNSIPTETFFYGQFIRGMKPAITGARPQPLATNVMYRLLVVSDKIKGQLDFEIK